MNSSFIHFHSIPLDVANYTHQWIVFSVVLRICFVTDWTESVALRACPSLVEKMRSVLWKIDSPNVNVCLDSKGMPISSARFVSLMSKTCHGSISTLSKSTIYELICVPLASGSLTGGCRNDEECPQTQACISRSCTNPCTSCGVNAVCEVKRHRAVCQCPEGFEGNPMIGCRGTRIKPFTFYLSSSNY